MGFTSECIGSIAEAASATPDSAPLVPSLRSDGGTRSDCGVVAGSGMRVRSPRDGRPPGRAVSLHERRGPVTR